MNTYSLVICHCFLCQRNMMGKMKSLKFSLYTFWGKCGYFIIQKLKKPKQFPPKIYKLSKAEFSQFDRIRRDKKQIFRTQIISERRYCLTKPSAAPFKWLTAKSLFCSSLQFAVPSNNEIYILWHILTGPGTSV